MDACRLLSDALTRAADVLLSVAECLYPMADDLDWARRIEERAIVLIEQDHDWQDHDAGELT